MQTLKSTVFAILLAALAACGPAYGQVQELKQPMSEGFYPAFTIRLEGLTKKEMLALFKDQIKKFTGENPKRKKGEYLVDQVFVPWNPSPLRFFAVLDEEFDETHQVKVWLESPEGYLNSETHEKGAEAVINWLEELEYLSKGRTVELVVEQEQSTLQELEREYDLLLREHDRLERAIADYEQKLEEARQRLAENEQEQIDLQQEIENQKQSVKGVRTKLAEID